jgi:hypothetical protein
MEELRSDHDIDSGSRTLVRIVVPLFTCSHRSPLTGALWLFKSTSIQAVLTGSYRPVDELKL